MEKLSQAQLAVKALLAAIEEADLGSWLVVSDGRWLRREPERGGCYFVLSDTDRTWTVHVGLTEQEMVALNRDNAFATLRTAMNRLPNLRVA